MRTWRRTTWEFPWKPEQVVQNQTESTDRGSLTTWTTSFPSEKHKSTLFYCETSPVSFTRRRALLRCHDGVGEDGQEQFLKPVGVPPRSAPRTKGQITFGRAWSCRDLGLMAEASLIPSQGQDGALSPDCHVTSRPAGNISSSVIITAGVFSPHFDGWEQQLTVITWCIQTACNISCWSACLFVILFTQTWSTPVCRELKQM